MGLDGYDGWFEIDMDELWDSITWLNRAPLVVSLTPLLVRTCFPHFYAPHMCVCQRSPNSLFWIYQSLCKPLVLLNNSLIKPESLAFFGSPYSCQIQPVTLPDTSI